MSEPLVELQSVSKRFVQPLDFAGKIARSLGADVSDEVVHAVEDVSFAVHEGEVVGLVGESGCGKSTLGRMVAGILEASSGTIRYRGREEAGLKVQMIFQDPFASLNPRMRVRDIVGEAPVVHGLVKKADLDTYLDGLLLRCGLDPSYKPRYPHQFSGGQRSRIGIARALAVKPEFLVCDEAVAALDVSIQAQILNLFMALRRDLGLTYLFISHDLGVVEHLSDRVVIMYLGRVVESAPTEDIFKRANHPYTQALLRQVPRLDTRKTQFKPIVGEIPSPLAPPPGCHFHPRCPHAMPRCREEAPRLKEVGSGHLSACHLNDARP
ncbi:MAG TPA: ABC transporter ATP-binding protein [Burkholderiales bacterium]|nr:ABC transporter ATP-binding protein [Burkholderiales bacterium]